MKHFISLVIFSALTMCTSCTKLLLHIEGIKQPRLESHNSLSNFLSLNGIDTTEMLCFNNMEALTDFYRSGIGIPDSRFFNRSKRLVSYHSSPDNCNGKVAIFLDQIDTINKITPNEKECLDAYLSNLVHTRTNKAFNIEEQEYDVYILTYWAKYLGKVNKRKVFEWQGLVQKAQQSGKKVRMVLINTDYQHAWGITKEQIPKFEY